MTPGEPNIKRKHVLCPGEVVSAFDGDTHFISARQLARLYGVPLSECVVRNHLQLRYDGLVELYPDPSGRYELPSRRSGGELNGWLQDEAMTGVRIKDLGQVLLTFGDGKTILSRRSLNDDERLEDQKPLELDLDPDAAIAALWMKVFIDTEEDA